MSDALPTIILRGVGSQPLTPEGFRETLERVLSAPDNMTTRQLAEIAGLDPTTLFVSRNFSGDSFDNDDLSGFAFRNSELVNTGFDNSIMNASASNCCQLQNCSFSSSRISSAKIESTTLNNTRLNGIKGQEGLFGGCKIIECDLRAASLTDWTWSDTEIRAGDFRGS